MTPAYSCIKMIFCKNIFTKNYMHMIDLRWLNQRQVTQECLQTL